MVSDKISRDTKLSNDMIEYKMSGRLTIEFNSRHSLFPFREIIHGHNDVMVPTSRGWVGIHKVYPSLGEGTKGNNMM